MSAEREIIPTSEVQFLPTVVYDPKVVCFGSPFNFEIDRVELSRLLTDRLGMPQEQVGKVKVNVSSEIHLSGEEQQGGMVSADFTLGSTNYTRGRDGLRQINLFVGTEARVRQEQGAILDAYRYLPATPQLLSLQQILEVAINEGFHTKKLPEYLRKVDEERATRFVDRFLARVAAKRIRLTLLHEASHVADLDKQDLLLDEWQNRIKIAKRFARVGYGVLAAAILGGLFRQPEVVVALVIGEMPLLATAIVSIRQSKDAFKNILGIRQNTERKAQEFEGDASYFNNLIKY